LNPLQKEQLHRAKHQRTDADDEPDLPDMTHEFRAVGMRGEQTEEGRIQP